MGIGLTREQNCLATVKEQSISCSVMLQDEIILLGHDEPIVCCGRSPWISVLGVHGQHPCLELLIVALELPSSLIIFGLFNGPPARRFGTCVPLPLGR